VETEEFRATVHRRGQASILTLTGELDLSSYRALERAIGRVLQADPELVVLDLAGVGFMDVAGLRAVLAADRRLRASGKRLVLAAPPRSVRRLLSLTGHEQAVSVLDSVEAALDQDLR